MIDIKLKKTKNDKRELPKIKPLDKIQLNQSWFYFNFLVAENQLAKDFPLRPHIRLQLGIQHNYYWTHPCDLRLWTTFYGAEHILSNSRLVIDIV